MKEKLSAMLDGYTDDATVHALLARLRRDPAFRNEWDTYCLLGDTIRGYAPPELEGFTARVMASLENEPIVFAPRRIGHAPDETVPQNYKPKHCLRRILVPAAASVMGILMVWAAVVALSRGYAPSVVSSDPSPETVTAVVRPDAGQDYLFAHQALAGSSPMPSAVQYVRTVSTSTEE